MQNKWVLKLQDPGFGTRRYSDDAYGNGGSRSDGKTLKDDRLRTIATFDGKTLKDDRLRTIATFDGKTLKDDRLRTIATVNGNVSIVVLAFAARLF
ncbi:hypothetical protein [Enterobacter ludwigii]|uniref:hypothetical protein n=1 Tax=Enterobacter ludwigii TaxID=299767 RepID=UPI001CC2B21E|nr:hypothetical protein [Enterobacter ludwigii]